MTNLGNAVNDIVKWLGAATKKIGSLIQAGDAQNAVLLVADIQTVVTAYLTVVKQFLPAYPVTPMPSNFWSQLSWIFKNVGWLQVLLTLLTGANPFDAAKMQAKSIALKWGFASEVY